MSLRTLLAVTLLVLAVPGCRRDDSPPVPASSDPEGNDMIEGAVVAAVETIPEGGIRLYKVVHFSNYPPPIGYEYDMVAFDPKVATFEDAAKLWKSKRVTVAHPHVNVRWINFKARDHRVLAVEPLNDFEKGIYKPQSR